MDLADRLRHAWPKKGYTTQTAFATAAGISKQYLSGILGRTKGEPSPEVERGIARALGIERAALLAEDDGVFLAALETHDPTAPEPLPPDEPAASEDRGTFRSLPVETFAHPSGIVDGSLAIDVIKRPSGKPGALLKKRHAQRSDRSVQTQHVLIEGVPEGAELVRVEGPLELRDNPAQVETIPKGHLLIVDRERKAEAGRLVIAVKNVDMRTTEEPPDVRLFRYWPVGQAWSLAALDGSGKTYGSGDGWEVVAAVLWWRSPP